MGRGYLGIGILFLAGIIGYLAGRVEKKNIFVRQTAAYHISDMHGNSMRIEYLLFFL